MLTTTSIDHRDFGARSNNQKIITKTTCYHCGEDCDHQDIYIDEKIFCCDGCKMVYEILNENDMCTYYNLESNKAGISLKSGKDVSDYEVLEDIDVQKRLIDFENDSIVKVTFYMPQIHCTACIWLLE
ncbi:MAG: heavy metal translocating P-type ATPase metal-binding domain-containing protein, partial [Saprospiraceae bacterium]